MYCVIQDVIYDQWGLLHLVQQLLMCLYETQCFACKQYVSCCVMCSHDSRAYADTELEPSAGAFAEADVPGTHPPDQSPHA